MPLNSRLSVVKMEKCANFPFKHQLKPARRDAKPALRQQPTMEDIMHQFPGNC